MEDRNISLCSRHKRKVEVSFLLCCQYNSCYSSSAEEKEKWIDAIQRAIMEQANKQQTFHTNPSDTLSPEHVNIPLDAPPGSPIHIHPPGCEEDIVGDISDVDLGTRAPRWVKDQEVTMCMICSKPFHKIMRRRHHCRACGRVGCIILVTLTKVMWGCSLEVTKFDYC